MAYIPAAVEYRVPEEELGSQQGAVAIRLASGNIMAFWIEGDNIERRLLDEDGAPTGEDASFGVPGTSDPGDLNVAPLESGGFVLSWIAKGDVGFDIHAYRFDAAGQPIGHSTVTEPSASYRGDPEVTGLDGGGFMVLWTEGSANTSPPTNGDGSDSGVRARIFGSDGAPAGSSFVVSSPTAGAQAFPAAATLASGNVAIAYTDYGSPASTIRIQIRAGDGTTKLAAWSTGAGTVNDVVALSNGNFVVLYGHGLGRIFDEQGNAIGPAFQVSEGDDKFSVSGAAMDGGGFVVTWMSLPSPYNSGGDDLGSTSVRAQIFNAAGGPIGGTIKANQITEGEQMAPFALGLEGDRTLILWTDSSGWNDHDLGIKGRLFVPEPPEPGRDVLTGTPGADDMAGGPGDDIYTVNHSGDVVREKPGEGFDIAYVSVNWTLGAGSEVERLFASVPDGRGIAITGNELGQWIWGRTGNDSLFGGGGNDVLIGDPGNDRLDGGTGADSMGGGTGDDRYFVDHAGDLTLEESGQGFDIVYARTNYVLHSSSHIEVLTADGLAPGAGIALTGNGFAQSIVGGAGNDSLSGLGGNDVLTGHAGNDRLDGGTGIDSMNGGAGDDRYFVDHEDDVVLEAAGGGSDAVYASSSYALRPSAEVETLAASGLAPGESVTLHGNDFAQGVSGGAEGDSLFGHGGDDALRGHGGDDLLDGGAGRDQLYGGAGADVFRFSSAAHSTAAAGDKIYDFAAGDRIDLSPADAHWGAAGDQAFTFIGAAAFGNKAGELRVAMDGATAHIYGDSNGDGTADLYIVAYNLAAPLTANDFTL